MSRGGWALLAILVAGAAVPAAAGGARDPAPRLLAFVAAEREARLVAVDVARVRVVRRIAVAAGPHNVTASRDGRHVLVTSPPAGRVTLVDGRSLRTVAVFAGLGYPHDVKLARTAATRT